MNVEIILTHRFASEEELLVVLSETLQETLEKVTGASYDTEEAAAFITLYYSRSMESPALGASLAIQSFTTDLSRLDDQEEEQLAESVLLNFIGTLNDIEGIQHVVKFEDPHLSELLLNLAEEVFGLEMRLRRALTIIYLTATNSREPYNLLVGESIKTQNFPPKKEMIFANENQFFHLLFGDYRGLNSIPKLQIEQLLRRIEDSTDFGELKSRIVRRPVRGERDADFLSNAKELLNPIESLRNCVAHNRKPSDDILIGYRTAQGELNELLDAFFAAQTENPEEEEDE